MPWPFLLAVVAACNEKHLETVLGGLCTRPANELVFGIAERLGNVKAIAKARQVRMGFRSPRRSSVSSLIRWDIRVRRNTRESGAKTSVTQPKSLRRQAELPVF
jgi:hypothetical protein